MAGDQSTCTQRSLAMSVALGSIQYESILTFISGQNDFSVRTVCLFWQN